MKTERTQIHSLSDILVAVAWLDLKVPITYQTNGLEGEIKDTNERSF